MEQQLTLFPDARPYGSCHRRRSRPSRHPPDARGCHANSMAARDAALPRINARAQHILAWMIREAGPGLTDRQIRDGFAPGQDMDYVRPRITELLDAGLLFEVDKVLDPLTNVSVRRTAPAAPAYRLTPTT